MARISLVIPTFSGGGMERVMSQLAAHFSQAGHEVHLVFLIRHTPFYDIPSEINTHFPDFEYSKERGIKKAIYWFRIIGYLRKAIKVIKPDTVFSIPQGYSNLTILSTLGMNIPIFISDRNSPAKEVSAFKNWVRRKLYPLAAGVICQTEYARQSLEKAGVKNNNFIVIPNPIKKLENYPRKQDSKRVVLNVGRFVNEKNQEELIQMFAKINMPGWLLYIVGDGPLKEKLEQKIMQLEMQASIKLIAPVKEIEVVLSQADIFAFTSIYEGFPNALGEAMAYPLACIAYDCIAGPSDMIIDGQNGFLIKEGDTDGYVSKLALLMQSSDLRSYTSERSISIRTKYSLETIGNRYLAFLLDSSYTKK